MVSQHARRQRGLTLVELLVGMTIMSVISLMLLTAWFALGKSYSFTLSSSDARDYGRQAMSRLQREIRDAQKPQASYFGGSAAASDAIVYRARPYWIAFTTTFNKSGNSTMAWQNVTPTPSATPTHKAVPTTPHLVVYRLYRDGEIWRFEDKDGDGAIDMSNSGTFNMTGNYPTDYPVNEQVYGEGRSMLVKNVVNYTAHATPIPLFAYNYYNDAGVMQSDTIRTANDRYDIKAVQMRVLIDLDPARAPVYADMRGTAQLRNNL